MKKVQSPYACHIFVCTNCHDDGEKSCSHGNSKKIREILKEEVRLRGWKGRVRVSETGCMGLCTAGPNVLIHPQNIWFSNVGEYDIEDILNHAKTIIGLSAR
ncbi:MAG: (2Fe-2S) ferredoxin domain-containing protein [Proteobacteria bacterium]|nr:(2Fe-2S) ferredoxin domain-containing protein [Pseudomonadota bacterium]